MQKRNAVRPLSSQRAAYAAKNVRWLVQQKKNVVWLSQNKRSNNLYAGQKGEKMRATEKNKIIKNIMQNFDFERVHRVMIFFNWWWSPHNGVPTIKEIKQQAQQLLGDVLLERGVDYSATGGFIASKNKRGVNLLFRITESTYEWPEKENK